MAGSARPLASRNDLELLFDELGHELLRDDTVAEVVMVGGSWLLWHEQRASTRDVDSARKVGPGVAEAVRRVAARRGLPDDWLNDRASMFWPDAADFADCEVAYESGGLVVRVPAARVLFVMKLYRGLPQDHEDMVLIWDRCGFSDPFEAAEAFRAAFPHAPEDEFLADYIAEIEVEAGSRRTR